MFKVNIINFEHTSHFLLVFLLLVLSMYLFAGLKTCSKKSTHCFSNFTIGPQTNPTVWTQR